MTLCGARGLGNGDPNNGLCVCVCVCETSCFFLIYTVDFVNGLCFLCVDGWGMDVVYSSANGPRLFKVSNR